MDLKNYNIFISATTLQPFVIYDEVLWIGENFSRPVKTAEDIENVVGKHYFPIPKETIDFWIKEKNGTYEWLFPFLLKECYDEIGGFFGETIVEDGGEWNNGYWEPYYKSTLEYSQYKEKIYNLFKQKHEDFINNNFVVKEKYKVVYNPVNGGLYLSDVAIEWLKNNAPEADFNIIGGYFNGEICRHNKYLVQCVEQLGGLVNSGWSANLQVAEIPTNQYLIITDSEGYEYVITEKNLITI